MFPKFNIEETAGTTKQGVSFLFDFDTGDFVTVDGKLIEVTGIEAVKVWINKILRTEKFKFKIYDEYGISLRDFIAKKYPLDFIKIEMEREIKEALAKNADILRVYDFNFTRDKRALECSFAVDTKYGTTGGEITI